MTVKPFDVGDRISTASGILLLPSLLYVSLSLSLCLLSPSSPSKLSSPIGTFDYA
jgi:hypothetical protein